MEEQIPLVGIIHDKQDAPLPLERGGLEPAPYLIRGWGWTKELSRDIVNIAKTLRKRATDAEKLIWRHLRAARLEGLKFRRQHPIGNYVIDFVCLEKQIVIEVDGGQACNREGKG